MRKLIAIAMAVLLICSAYPFPPANAAEASTHIKKIVSLVYDDSGSMKGDKWAYANYAVQTFCGLLTDEDQLYITYMSRAQTQNGYKPEPVDLSAGGIQKAVDTLRSHNEDMDTPFTSVELAFQQLREIPCEDENAQYWLVVITDGVFDEIISASAEGRKKFLNDKFRSYAGASMPNGTRLQTTFLSIGNVTAPDQNEGIGIYTYPVDTAEEIVSAMSNMAHRVSGGTRVDKNSIVRASGNAVEITTSLPLLNIAAVTQKTNATVTSVKDRKGNQMKVSRTVSVSYPGYSELQGKIYLINHSKKIMDEGKYTITFDGDFDPEQLVFMLEPAVETRIFIEHGGKVYSSISEIEKLTERDKIHVSFKAYKIGSNEEIPQDWFESGTKFVLELYEGENKVLSNENGSLELPEYILTDKEVRIKANVQVKGFNPIESTMAFVPARYGSGEEFSIQGEPISESQKIRYHEIASNESMGIVFTVYENGVPITDPEKVKATRPEITVAPSGNEGEVSVREDGKILYIPKKAQPPSPDAEKFSVEVSCTIGGNKTASKQYTVLVSDYEIVAATDPFEIVKTSLFQNEKAVSFYIHKNGTPLTKAALEPDFTVDFGEKFKKIKAEITVDNDGKINVRPYLEGSQRLTFFSWWFHWSTYFSLKEGEMNVTLSHELGQGQAAVKIVGEGFLYQILNVYLPLLIELALFVLFLIWLILILRKPRYTDTAKLYVGTVRYNRLKQNHVLTDFVSENLNEYNKIKRGNGRLKFKREADIISVREINIRAGHGNRIYCESPQPWYKVSIEPVSEDADLLRTPQQLEQYFSRHKKLEMEEISALETIDKESAKNMGPNNSRAPKYLVVPDGAGGSDNGLTRVDGRLVIKSGKLFIYTN